MELDHKCCLLCNGKVKLKAMCDYKIDNICEEWNCIDLFEDCFNLKFPKRNRFGKRNKMCIYCFHSLKDCYEFKQLAQSAFQKLDVNKHGNDSISSFDPFKCKLESEIKVEKDLNTVFEENSLDIPFEEPELLQIKYEPNTEDPIDDDNNFSDCSTKTQDILIATGYYARKEIDKFNVKMKRPDLQKGTLACPICKEEFFNYNLTRQHFAKHFPIGLCHICGKGFATSNGYKTHIEGHEEIIKKFVCKICNKALGTQQILHSHIKYTHKGVYAMTCYHCPRQFRSSVSRLIHMHKAHNIKCKFYECSKCDSKFYCKGYLDKHEKQVHKREMKFNCDLCPSGYMTKRPLLEHISYKHGDKSKSPQCDVCKRVFATSKGLRGHMMIHLNIRKHKCPYCVQDFVQKTSLDYHLKKHH